MKTLPKFKLLLKNRKVNKKRLLKIVSIITLFAFLNCLTGCLYFFKAITEKDFNPNRITQLDDDGKYFILHSKDNAWNFYDLQIKGDTINGRLDAMLYYHAKYLTPKSKGAQSYKKHKEPEVINEVHIYTSDTTFGYFNTNVSIPMASIQKITIYDRAKGATIISWILPPVLILAALIVIVTATDGSCPFVYTYNGNSYTLIGEIYGGATYPSLERHDYMPLPGFESVNDQYQLKISNELKEKQYTNLAELLIIQHPKNSDVFIDKYGDIQTLSMSQIPSSAIALNNRDYTRSITAKDNNFFQFNEYNTNTTINNLILTFKNQEYSETGKLVINAKNSLWSDYMYGEFTKLFGTYYNKWDEKQKQVSAKKHIKRALKQDIPLSVYMETEKGWEFVDFFHVVGSLAARDMVMSIDLSKAKSEDVRIKLESGFMFWELDYAAMDFSKNIPVETTLLKPSSAIDEKGNDVTSLLSENDDQYLRQFNIGDEVIVKYDIPVDKTSGNKESVQTVILHSKGHYESIRDYKDKPNWKYLIALKHPHSFSKFSFKKLEEASKVNDLVTLQK